MSGLNYGNVQPLMGQVLPGIITTPIPYSNPVHLSQNNVNPYYNPSVKGSFNNQNTVYKSKQNNDNFSNNMNQIYNNNNFNKQQNTDLNQNNNKTNITNTTQEDDVDDLASLIYEAISQIYPE